MRENVDDDIRKHREKYFFSGPVSQEEDVETCLNIVAVNDFLILSGWEKWAHSHSFKETSNFQPLEAPPPSCPLIHTQTFYSSELGDDQNVKFSCPLLFILDNNSKKNPSRLNTYS